MISVEAGDATYRVGLSRVGEAIARAADPSNPVVEDPVGTLRFDGAISDEHGDAPASEVTQLLFVNHTAHSVHEQALPARDHRFVATMPGHETDDVVLVARHASGFSSCFYDDELEPGEPGEPF